MKRLLLILSIAPFLFGATHIAGAGEILAEVFESFAEEPRPSDSSEDANVIFAENFMSYAEGTRPEEGWSWDVPGANINEQTVRETFGAEWEATNTLRILHDYDGAGGEDSRRFAGFIANWGETIEDDPIVFTTRFRFNELLGSQDIGLSLQGAGVIGPLIRFIEDGRAGELHPGIAANDGQTWIRMLTPLIYGDWYEMTITTIPSTGRYNITVVNLNSAAEGQSGSMSGLSYFTGPGAPGTLNRIGLARAGTFPQVDMHFDFFEVAYDPDPAPPEPVTLTVEVRGEGTVSREPDLELYEGGSEVVLTAVPAAGYVFSHWSGDATGSVNPRTVTMNTDRNIVATFIEKTMAESDYLFRETFESYEIGTIPTHPGDRSPHDWILSSPFPETEVTVVESSSTEGLDSNLNSLRLYRPTSVGSTQELAVRRSFAAVTDEPLEFSVKVRYNQDLGDTLQGFFLRDGASGSVTFGPYITATLYPFMADSGWVVRTPGGGMDPLINPIQIGDWYEITIVTVPSSGLYDITIVNLDAPEDTFQSATRTGVPFFHNVSKLDMIQISRTGQHFVVDADYDDFTVLVEGSGAVPSTGFVAWKEDFFGSADHPDAGDLDDSDGDGVVNLLEYGLAGNPTIASRDVLPAIEIDGDRIAIRFRRIDPADIGYTVWASSNLTEWLPIATLPAGATSWTGPAADAGLVTEAAENGTVSVTVRDVETIGDSERRFLQLSVEAP